MRKTIIVAAVIAALASVVWAKLVDKIVVKVNDEVILQSEVDEAVELLFTQLKMAGKSADKAAIKKEIVTNMLEQKLITTMAKVENISISEEAVADRTNEFVNTLRTRFANEAEFEDALLKEGMSYTDFRMKIDAQVRDNMAFTKVKQKKQQEFISKAAVTDDELQAYYGRNKSGFKVNDETNVSQIFFEKGKLEAQDTAKYLKEVSARIAAEGFEAVSKDLDGKPGIKAAALGWIDTAVLDSSVRAGLEGVKKGAVSKPVEKEDGFHILKVVDVKRGKLRSFEDVREKVRVKIIEEKVEKMWNDWMGKVKKDAFIKYM